MNSQASLLGPSPDASASQWFTPDWLAERVVAWAGVRPGCRVIELGAGDGAFVKPLVYELCRVTAVELDKRYIAAIEALRPEQAANANALHWPPAARVQFDAYIGNPPYENDLDIAFVERGLELAPRVVVVLRLVFLAGQERYRRIWAKHHLARIAYLSARPKFVGATSGGAKTDFAVFDIRRGPAPAGHRVETEWWVR